MPPGVIQKLLETAGGPAAIIGGLLGGIGALLLANSHLCKPTVTAGCISPPGFLEFLVDMPLAGAAAFGGVAGAFIGLVIGVLIKEFGSS